MGTEIPKDMLKDFFSKSTSITRENVKEIKGENWRLRSYDMKVEKGNEITVTKILSIQFNDSVTSFHLSEDGKLKSVIFFETKDVGESDETVKKSVKTLTISYDKGKAIFQEVETELYKGKTGFDSIKSIRVIKNGEYNL
jgi:hypothetical protein